MSGLVGAWRRHLPCDAEPVVVEHAGADLVSRWSQSHRHYHDLEHLAAVLTVIDKHASWATDPQLVRLAAWFHDAVYAPRRHDNEEASAALAYAVLRRLGMAEPAIHEVARLVRLTERHDPAPGDRNGELLCDADLAVLGSTPETYRHYAHRIRMEYAHVPDHTFRARRISVLRRLLALPSLYRVPPLRDTLEERARENLNRELSALSS